MKTTPECNDIITSKNYNHSLAVFNKEGTTCNNELKRDASMSF